MSDARDVYFNSCNCTPRISINGKSQLVARSDRGWMRIEFEAVRWHAGLKHEKFSLEIILSRHRVLYACIAINLKMNIEWSGKWNS